MRFLALALALVLWPACQGDSVAVVPNGAAPLSLEDELSFRQLREDFHLATMTGDADLMRRLWSDDAVLQTPQGAVVGGDAIAAFLASNPDFGRLLVVTRESSWRVETSGNIAEYGFESVSIDVGDDVPGTTALSIAGAQNPDVEIVGHSHSTGLARVESGRWVFAELNNAAGPLPPEPAPVAALTQVTEPDAEPSLGDELGFRRMRETFHFANLSGDRDLMRTVWADDAVFVTGGGAAFEGRDAIVDFFAGTPGFGRWLVLTPESSQRITIDGDIAHYAFECIAIDVGGADPESVDLCTEDGSQNPLVEIVMHTNSQGRAIRVADGEWMFLEFNGGGGPLPPAGE